MPATAPSKSEPSQKQIEFLKRVGKYKEGMTFEEAKEILDSIQYMEAGFHEMHITKVIPWMDRDGIPKKDTRGFPGVMIYFTNRSGATASAGFYFDPRPLNDPDRDDPQNSCKSEYLLDRLKAVAGLTQESSKPQEYTKKWFWGMVQEIRFKDPVTGEPVLGEDGKVLKKTRLAKDRFAMIDKKPLVLGDPLNVKPGESPKEPDGDFLIWEVYNKSTTGMKRQEENNTDWPPKGPSLASAADEEIASGIEPSLDEY